MSAPLSFAGRRYLPQSPAVVAFAGLACVGVWFSADGPFLLTVATGFFLAAAFLSLIQERPVDGEWDSDQIRVGNAAPIPFDTIEGLTANGVPPRAHTIPQKGKLRIFHPGGVACIPASTPSTTEIYESIWKSLPLQSKPESLPSGIKIFYQNQVKLHGAEVVWAFGARRFPQRYQSYRKAMFFAFAMFIFAWSTHGSAGFFKLDHSGDRWVAILAVIATAIGVIGLLVAAILWKLATSPGKNHTDGIVIGPGGIAVSQGGVEGKISWDTDPFPPPIFADRPQKPGIHFPFEGARFVIRDGFTCPIQLIFCLLESSIAVASKPKQISPQTTLPVALPVARPVNKPAGSPPKSDDGEFDPPEITI